MKRHNAGELPLSSPPGDGRRLLPKEEAEDKMDKYDKGRVRCSRLCFLFALAATVSILARHCYDAGLAGGDGAGVVRIETVPPSVRRERKIVPIARGSGPSESGHSHSAPVDASGAGDAADSSSGAKTSSKQGSPSGAHAHAHTEQRAGHPFARALAAADDKADLCGGQYIYVHDLPARFNKDMVQNCDKLSPWTDMCRYTTNGGFGPLLPGGKGAFQGTIAGWYDTDEHALDIVFHERIKRYECLTDDPSLAAAVFVPFYAGLDVARHLWGNNASARDELALDLAGLLAKSPEWRAMGGRDHFFVAGRATWDFRRKDDAHAEWGSRLLNLPAAKNMTALVVEASPWHLNDVAIPYPTSFHPASDEDLFFWQDRVRALDRSYLFSFAGVPRPGDAKSIEGHLVDQCRASDSCSLMECSTTGPDNRCESTASVMKLFQSSTFCLLPRGGTDTRRSAFDAMLAGCIPVFFHPGSAYVQYTWHLPKAHADYSVYIPEDDVRKKNESVEERLRKIPPETVREMRDAVVDLIPSVTYGDATSRLETTVKDAFDIAVAAVISKVTKLRRGIVEGRAEAEKLEKYSWKYPLLAEGQKAEDHHEWDPLFN
ncbi:xyloglucan galactosyltransferase KATAMARI1 homolog [Zea mays]|jgi:xyloglucan galactosyltransferase MUR3|uniref:Xyloglucan galactosyltransferase MUR3 n=1 Tax=Zea mays TaxID=4577 RepID=A0A1D6KU02_MAIZE|nr:xyloglucan galactosyltransferase KATAMARI1 homolog [Zea mays]ONM06064.1 Xyloglucan galactosyltransferase MUR3 [Zea mays]|eukprot:XP_008664906.1 xyloglucan galactosyltransferase KATAMARI1 homolog [Zea mays]